MVVEWWAETNCVPNTRAKSAPTAPTVARNDLIETSPALCFCRPSGSPLGCDDISPYAALDLDEDMVAVRVKAFGVASLLADAFDDIEFSRPLSEENARRLPGRGQDLRSEDLQIIVQ